MQATKKTHVRYLILFMLFLVTTINYADRATIAIAEFQPAERPRH